MLLRNTAVHTSMCVVSGHMHTGSSVCEESVCAYVSCFVAAAGFSDWRLDLPNVVSQLSSVQLY